MQREHGLAFDLNIDRLSLRRCQPGLRGGVSLPGRLAQGPCSAGKLQPVLFFLPDSAHGAIR